jgi:hypothetical protein
VDYDNLLRMRRAPNCVIFFYTRELLTDSIHASVEEQVAMFLHVCRMDIPGPTT